MKYGEVLSYKDVKKAKNLIGKKVISADEYYCLQEQPEKIEPCILTAVIDHEARTGYVFHFDNRLNGQFIREVIEEEPKYRPYKDCKEMIEDFKLSKESEAFAKLRAFLMQNFRGTQTFSTQNFLGDSMSEVYNADGITVLYCGAYDYLEVLGLPEEAYRSLSDILDLSD